MILTGFSRFRAARRAAALGLLVWPVAALAQSPAGRAPSLPITALLSGHADDGVATVAGRATVRSGVLQPRVLDIAIDDGTGGIRVFSRTARDAVQEGDSVVVTGRPGLYRGTPEVQATAVHVVPGPRRPVAPRPLDLGRDQIGDLVGRLVSVNGVVRGRGMSEGGEWLRLDAPEGTGASLNVWVPAPLVATVPLDRYRERDRLSVTGIVAAYQDNPNDPVVWQVIPRRAGDIVSHGVPVRWLALAPWALLVLVALGAAGAIVARLAARRQTRALRETEARYRQLLELSPEAVLVHDFSGRILFTNPAAARLLGAADERALVGRPVGDFLPEDDAERHTVDGDTRRWRGRLRGVRGEMVDVEVAAGPCRYHDRAAAVVMARDIGAQLRYERDLRMLALVDELTGLPNRRGFLVFAEQELRRARHEGRAAALVFADLDGLKQLNDERGHHAGDVALRTVASALSGLVHGTNVVGRWAGDEFVALLTEDAEASAESFATRLAEALAGRTALGAPVSASVGACALLPGEGLAAALERADAALYREKRRRPATAASADV